MSSVPMAADFTAFDQQTSGTLIFMVAAAAAPFGVIHAIASKLRSR
jgi:hypothetical protein